MKKVLVYVGAGLMLGLASCGKDANVGGTATQDGPRKIRITMKATRQALPTDEQARAGDTRVTLDGTTLKWSEGDSFLLMDDQGGAYKFDIVSGWGTPDGTFTGEVDANSARGEYYPYFMAINPYESGNNFASSTQTVPADQVSDNTPDGGVGKYIIQIGAAFIDANSGSDNLPESTVQFMGNVTAIWDVIINNPSNLPIRSVKIRAMDDALEPFTISSTQNNGLVVGSWIPDAAPVPTFSSTYSNYIATTFDSPQSADRVTARLALFPVNFSNATPLQNYTDLQFEVTLDNGQTYIFYRPGIGSSLAPGSINHSTIANLNDPAATIVN